MLSENGIQAPKVTLPQVISNGRAWLDTDQISQLVKSVKGKNEELSVLLALHSLRRSELLALDWKNVDLENKTLTIKGAVVPNEKHKFVEKETNKNTTSNRTIPIMIPELIAALTSIENKTGKVMTCSPHTVCNRINKACREADLHEVGTHGLRHSFASLAYHLGMSELETMEIGGWADTQTMHNIYTHLAAKDRIKAENKMTEFYKSANKNANNNKKASITNAYTVD
ncbi:MAG: site-specific integrase [Bacteroides sp.]